MRIPFTAHPSAYRRDMRMVVGFSTTNEACMHTLPATRARVDVICFFGTSHGGGWSDAHGPARGVFGETRERCIVPHPPALPGWGREEGDEDTRLGKASRTTNSDHSRHVFGNTLYEYCCAAASRPDPSHHTPPYSV